MNNYQIKRTVLLTFTCTLLLISILFSGCIDPVDDPVIPERGFFMGILPTPAEGQDLSDTYLQASEHAECVPIWSSGTAKPTAQ